MCVLPLSSSLACLLSLLLSLLLLTILLLLLLLLLLLYHQNRCKVIAQYTTRQVDRKAKIVR
jgi:hypothetical protein